MVRIIGAGLLLTASTALGFSAAAELRAHVRELEQFIGSFELMERELKGRLTPLPELLRLAANTMKTSVKEFYLLCSALCAKKQDRSFSFIWKNALRAVQLRLTEPELQVVESLGEVLGRYDAGSQIAALQEASERLKGELAAAKERQIHMGKVYGALGMTAGMFLVIILI